MPDRRRTSRVAATALSSALLLGAAGFAAPASAQSGEQSVEREARQLLDDFAHFVFIRNDDLAAAYGQALLDLNLTPMEFVAIVEDDPRLSERFDETTRRALVIDAVEPSAAALRSLFESGQLERARDPQQIARNIQLLKEDPRAQRVARERLVFASEYAVPQLLQVLMARADQVLESQVQRLLIDMGSRAVAPLAAALPGVDQETQRRIVTILGQSQVRTALPYLYELRASGESMPRDLARAVDRAINSIDGGPASGVTPAGLYLDLAESYYREQASLTQFSGESHQLVWEYNPGFGLNPVAVRTEVYHEAMAMRLGEHAAELGANPASAAGLWLAANFSREIDAPSEYDNPLYPAEKRGATYYAVAAGPTLTGNVLERALRDRDTPLIRRAIAALAETAGGAADWRDNPLTDALAYPDRRVQYEAALAIAQGRPTSPFGAAERVVPTLAAAIREASDRFALVIATELEDQQAITDRLRAAGYTVLAPASTLAGASGAIAEAAGVDLIVSQLSQGATDGLLGDVRSESKLRVTPVLAVVAGAASTDLASRYADDALVRVVRAGVSDQQFATAADQLARAATGEAISEGDAQEYAFAALSALRDLAVSGSTVLDVTAAARPLVGAFEEDGPLAIVLADVLAHLDSAEAQQALLGAAIAGEGPDRIALFQHVVRSVRAHGSMLEGRQVRGLLELARSGELSEDEAVAAGALIGSLDLDGGGADFVLNAG